MEAQENSQTEQNAQAPKKRELALVSRSTYIKEKALQWIFLPARSWRLLPSS